MRSICAAASIYKVYDINFTDAYRTMDGLARTISFTYQDIKQFTNATSDFSTQTLAGGLNWGYPITENQSLTFGFSLQHAEMLTSFFSSDQQRQWVQNNGTPIQIDGSGGLFGTEIDSLELVLGWSYDTRNRALFPDAGSRVSFNLNTALPGSDVEYFVSRFDYTRYFRLPGSLAIQGQFRARIRRRLRRQDDGAAAVSKLLRWWSELDPRLQGKLPWPRSTRSETLMAVICWLPTSSS